MNRSMPPSTGVIPELVYPDVAEASGWLCAAFGFTERLRIGTHRAQPVVGERQYTAEDLAGHRWSFSQSIADVAPEEWGGTTPAVRAD